MGVRVVFPDMGKDPSVQLIEKTITQNGTYDAITDGANGYSKVNVNVEGGGGGEPDIYYNITINAVPEVLQDIYFGNNYTVNNYHSMINNEEIQDSEIVIDLSEGVTNLQLKLLAVAEPGYGLQASSTKPGSPHAVSVTGDIELIDDDGYLYKITGDGTITIS